MKDIIHLTVSLKHSKPLIWRSMLVSRDITFFELHHIIQIAMGWKNYHLFEFNLDGYRIGMSEENEYGYGRNMLIDATKTLLTDIISTEKDMFNYIYDFGDDWVHEITVEKPEAKPEATFFPCCVKGEYNCPPEDCGGIPGFHDLLKILQNKKHPEHKETKLWVGKKYDPLSFDPLKVNKQLKQLQRYISRWKSPD